MLRPRFRAPWRVRLLIATLAAGAAVAAAGGASAAAQWRRLVPARAPGEICLTVSGQTSRYVRLDADDAAVLTVTGPRRVRMTLRHLGPAGIPAAWTTVVAMDGRETLRRRLTGKPARATRPCDGDAEVSAARALTVDVPAGAHELRVTARAEGTGQVGARFAREVRRKAAGAVPFAPEGYGAARRLQLESGQQSLWYAFGPDAPLRFTVNGPTTLSLYSRLDFDHTMNGAQTYALAIERDGQAAGTWHFSATRQDGTSWVGLGDVVPGQRNALRVEVPRGRHRYTVRCVQPGACTVAAQILMPRSALRHTPSGPAPGGTR